VKPHRGGVAGYPPPCSPAVGECSDPAAASHALDSNDDRDTTCLPDLSAVRSDLRPRTASVRRIRGDLDDVFSKGFICPKGTTLGKFHDDPDRLRRPLVRRNGTHVAVSWEEAFAAIADRMLPVIDAHGRDKTAIYLGNPVVHSIDASLFTRAVIKGLGAHQIYSAATVDQRPRELASSLIYGHPGTIPVPDIDRTDMLVLLGANPWVSNGSLATAPDWPGRLDALAERGGTLVVVDPARTRTAEDADVHLAIRPTTDGLLLAAIATELVARKLSRPNPLDIESLDIVSAALAPFTAHTVAARVGLDESQIVDLVDRLAAANRPCVYSRLGTSVTPFGTTASWLTDIVNALLGALDSVGGLMFPKNPAGSSNSTSDDPYGKPRELGRRRTGVKGLPVELGEHPVSAIADEILAGNVRAMVMVAGNPVLSCPDGDALDSRLSCLRRRLPKRDDTPRRCHPPTTIAPSKVALRHRVRDCGGEKRG